MFVLFVHTRMSKNYTVRGNMAPTLVAFYLLKVISALRSMSYKWGNLVVARAGWMDAEEERSEMKVEVNIQPSDISLSLNRYYDFFLFIGRRFDMFNNREGKKISFL